MRRFVRRLLNVFHPDAAETDLAREIAAHLAIVEDDFRRRGMSARDARLAANRAMGSVTHTKDLHRDARSFVWLDDARRDVGYAMRMLRRNPTLTTTAVLSLAIGIGANTAIFTVANALLLRPPVGVMDPGRLVDIGIGRIDGGFNPGSYPTYLDIRQRATTLDGVFAHPMFPQAMSLRTAGNNAVERIFGHSVTSNYFTVLGTVPFVGRLFSAAESDQPGADPVVVLSHRFWTSRFDQDAAVIGQSIQLNGQTFTVLGVTPEGFQGTGIVAGDVWIPLGITGGNAPDSTLTNRTGGWLVMGGRLKPGVPLAQAAAELEAIGVALDREYPTTPAAVHKLLLLPSSRVPGNRTIVGGFVGLLMTIVAIVLVVACANVAGMLIARASSRRQEIAVRLAMGAGRGRLIRQLVTETAVLFVFGGIGGLALARALTSLIVPLLPPLPMPVSVSLSLDGPVIAFTMGLSLIAAVLSGLAPALQAANADVVTALKDEAPAASGRSRVRHSFVVAQVAFSLVLVVVSGLFVRALQQAGSMNPGFDPHGVELASLDLSIAGYTDSTGPRFARDLLDRVRRLPDVQAATIARTLPGGFEGIGLGGVTAPAGVPADPLFVPAWNIVEPGYFATLRIPLVAGRDFSATDLAGATPVTIIGEGVARRFWPGQNAVGQHLAKQVYGPDRRPNGMQALLVVGVARDVKTSSLVDGQAESYVYVPLQQQYETRMTANMTIAARSSHGQRIADQIRSVVAAMNPTLPIVTSQTLEESAALGLTPHRVVAAIAGSLGIVGVLLAAIGIYGVTAYAVTRRTREFGIRLALGAQRADIVGMVLGQGMRLAVIGSAIGLALSAAASHVLVGILFGVSPMDPVIFGGATTLFIAIGLAACYGPARRATKVDPLVALRYE